MREPTRDTEALDAALAACANEPIHFSGGIQPHGYLVSCTPESGIIRHVSANCHELFEAEPAELIGHAITDFLLVDLPPIDRDADAQARYTRAAVHIASNNVGPQARFCDLSLHLAQGLLHLEIEPLPMHASRLSAAELAHDMILRISLEGDDEASLHAAMADQVRQLTGFDRVMVYRFLADDSGEVIAESLADGVQSYLGLRYPASDIPPQARALYLKNRVRVIAQTDYVPSPIVPAQLADGSPLDLSLHGLRSVSPVHLEYMRNMGMAASMSISIVVDGRLWGLVACHHRQPRQLPPRHRTAADLLGMFYSLRVASMQHLRESVRKTSLRTAWAPWMRALQDAEHADVELARLLLPLCESLSADAAALISQEGVSVAGADIPAATLAAARAWFEAQDTALAATALAAEWQQGSGASRASPYAGVLAMRLPNGRSVLLLRREQVTEVEWAGEPVKHLVSTDDGVRLAPRRSFNSWRETVRGQAQAWDRADLEDAEALHFLLCNALAAAGG